MSKDDETQGFTNDTEMVNDLLKNCFDYWNESIEEEAKKDMIKEMSILSLKLAIIAHRKDPTISNMFRRSLADIENKEEEE